MSKVAKMPPGLSARELQDLYDRYAPGMYRRAFALLQREADAWDAVQESCIRVLQSAAAFRREARPMTFIYRVTTNVCLNMLRTRALRDVAPEDAGSEGAVDALAATECRDFLMKLARELDERALTVATLHYLDGMSQEEIAQALGLSRKTIVRDVQRIGALARALGEPEGIRRGAG
ncbi:MULTISPECIES: RNA polymerase sigma factor [Myxococcus]|uniref:RNA polymerase sigma factor n=1 Tax=Myxococcus TaxID=32 RepID=UPI00112B4971|nr:MULTISPECIES: sigma-70 family RNA polymerase sigma factor [Myxococcus]QDE86651.1 RNA polymerase subunit sigma [Myxococcus xanthus]QDF00808.1 RNA polymerase subunit sigma [Myxococcus xanthus]QDF08648.1 RNA polymerase subunit sigma [Myxococcus xanthus]WAM26262.1 sigma-70 family RNA polymerase sigma factor [Myxococcus sp. NMCA1]